MSLFDETREKAKQVYSRVEKKTVTVAEVQKLRIKSLGVEADLRTLYEELGRAYYRELEKNGSVPDELKSTVDEIKQKTEELKKLKERVTELRGGTVCRECGAANPVGAVYCTGCSKKL